MDSSEFTFLEAAQPRASDKLFGSGPDWQMNACVNFMHDPSEGYIVGYKAAGDVLVAHVAETARDQDILVYPILFNYRHYVELRLKVIIRHAQRLVGVESQGRVTGHGLDTLWASAMRLVETAWPDCDKQDFENAGSIIKQLSQADDRGMTFRYGYDKDGKLLLNRSISHINLRNVREVLGRLAEFLDAVDTALVHETEL